MRQFLLPAIVLLAVVAGCSDEESTPGTPPGETPLAQTTVGDAGGVLEHDGFSLVIPAGAVTGDTQLRLYEDSPGSALPGAEAAPVLRIEGLPLSLAADLPLRLAHTSATGDSLYAMLGQPTYVPSLQQVVTTWQVVDCTDSLGWAVLDLPVAGQGPDKADDAPPLSVTIVRGVAETLTGDGHFKIYWSPLMATEQDIASLRDNIETAMALYDFMGFQQEGFDDWPIKAIVQPLDWFGHWAPNPRKLGGHLGFSTHYIDDQVEMPLTAGHELLHFCQYFYDPRTVLERGTESGPLVWLDEATAVYIEDYFAPGEEYCSAARGGRELALMDGLLVPREGRPMGEHGYGLSSLIRFLYEAEPGGDAFILDTYQDIKAGMHAAAALQANTTVDLTDRWMEILEELLSGNIYSDVTWATILDHPIRRLMSISGAADSTGTVNWDMPDLSGRLAYIDLNDTEFEDNQRLVFWCDAAEYGLTAYGIAPPDNMEFLSHAYGKVTLSNLPNLNENYDQVMLLVSNQHFAGPDYTGPTEIALEGRLRESEPLPHYTHGALRIQYDADWSNGVHQVNQEMNFAEVRGTFTGTTFTASWDSTGFNDVHHSGHLTANLDPSDLHVISWSARNYSWMDDGTSSDFQASGGVLPDVAVYNNSMDARIEGVETCGAIGGLSVTFINSDGETYRSLDGYTCSTGSYVKVLLYDRDQ